MDFRRCWSPIWGGTTDPDDGRSGSSALHNCRLHSWSVAADGGCDWGAGGSAKRGNGRCSKPTRAQEGRGSTCHGVCCHNESSRTAQCTVRNEAVFVLGACRCPSGHMRPAHLHAAAVQNSCTCYALAGSRSATARTRGHIMLACHTLQPGQGVKRLRVRPQGRHAPSPRGRGLWSTSTPWSLPCRSERSQKSAVSRVLFLHREPVVHEQMAAR